MESLDGAAARLRTRTDYWGDAGLDEKGAEGVGADGTGCLAPNLT